MISDSVEISVRGKWLRVPALNVNGNTICATGRRLRVAAVHDGDWLESELKDPEACIRELQAERGKRLRADIFTFAQMLPATTPKYPYPLEWDSIAAIRLTSFQNWWQRLPQESRKNVRRSEKRGVRLGLSKFDHDLVSAIMEVNNESPIRQGRKFPHHGKSFEEVKKDYSGFLDRSQFISAFFGNELTGLLKLVYRGEVASVLQLITKACHYDKKPANALLAKAVELCAANGVKYLSYGKFHYGNKRGDSLAEFKTRNGFEEFLLPRYYVPLTRRGAFYIKLGLHHGLLEILPRQIIALGLATRANWYDLKRSLSRCSSKLEQPNRNRRMERANPPAGSNL